MHCFHETITNKFLPLNNSLGEKEMSLTTVFLGVLAFALILGNFFLSLIQPAEGEITKEKGESHKKNFSQSNEELRAEKAIASSTKEELNERLFHKTLALEAKLGKIDNFRANTEIELKAMKEILLELQKNGITAKSKKPEKKKSKEKIKAKKQKNAGNLTTKDLHKIIFRSG